MKILAIRTDKPEAELYLYEDYEQLATLKWQAHRELAETVHKQISKILNRSSISLSDLEGIACFKGPGSFTGLRIGLSVANALAYAQSIPIVSSKGENWLKESINKLQQGRGSKLALPYYGHSANTSLPKK